MTTAVAPSHRNPSQIDATIPDSFGLSGDSDDWMERVREAETPTALGCIGPYELLNEVSRGGQGIVYRARQPGTNREIVVKRLLAGSFATPVMLRRFEREVELAASLNHPNIVTVFGIEMVDGQPLLAMEWIDGVPIDEWASNGESGRRSPKQIASMMRDVCDAVWHAHQHGVIHRDLKPSNILVDRSGVPHVLDFGLARQMDPEAEAGGKVTLTEQFVGTPAYASPEHLRSGTNAVDVRADVYSLGLVLYNALTGTLPYDVSGDLPDIFERIEHAEPVRPSTYAAHLDGEIESVVLKALAKEKERRYQSVDLLAEDLRRYVNDESLMARPASGWYQLKKLAKRNRGLFAGVGTVLLVLAVGVVISTWQAVRATRAEHLAAERLQLAETQRTVAQRQTAIAQAVIGFLNNDLLASAAPSSEHSTDVTVRQILDTASSEIEGRFPDEPLVEAMIRTTLGRTYRNLGHFAEATPHLEKALETRRSILGSEHLDTLTSMDLLGLVYTYDGHFADAQPLLTQALELRRDKLGDGHPATLTSINNMAVLYTDQGKYDEAESLFVELVAATGGEGGELVPEAMEHVRNLAQLYQQQGRYGEAEPLFRQALETQIRTLGADDPATLDSMTGLAVVYKKLGRHADAEPLLTEALQGSQRTNGEEHPDTLSIMNSLAGLYRKLEKYDQAEPLYLQVLAGTRQLRGDEHPHTIFTLNNLGGLYEDLLELEKAEALYKEATEASRRVFGEEHPNTLAISANLADCYKEQERYEEAESILVNVVAVLRRAVGEEHPKTLTAMQSLAAVYKRMGRYEEAEPLNAAAVAGARVKLPEGHPNTGIYLTSYGHCLTSLKRYTDAEAALLEGRGILLASYGEEHRRVTTATERLVELYDAWSKPAKADEYRALLTEEH